MKLMKSCLMTQYFTVFHYSYVNLTVNNLSLCRAIVDWNGCISDHSPLHWCLSQAVLCQGWTTVSVENKDRYIYMYTHKHLHAYTWTLTHTYVSFKHTKQPIKSKLKSHLLYNAHHCNIVLDTMQSQKNANTFKLAKHHFYSFFLEH